MINSKCICHIMIYVLVHLNSCLQKQTNDKDIHLISQIDIEKALKGRTFTPMGVNSGG